MPAAKATRNGDMANRKRKLIRSSSFYHLVARERGRKSRRCDSLSYPAPLLQEEEEDGGGKQLEVVLRDVLLPKLPLRMVGRMRTLSSVFSRIPLSTLHSREQPQESWLLLHRVRGKNLYKRPFPPWDFEVFSDCERKRFSLPVFAPSWLKDVCIDISRSLGARSFSDNWLDQATSFQLYDSSTRLWRIPQPVSWATHDSYNLIQCDFFTLYIEAEYPPGSFPVPPEQIPTAAHILGYRASLDKWFKTTLTIDIYSLFPKHQTWEDNFMRTSSAFVKRNGKLLMFVSGWNMWNDKRPTATVMEVSPVSLHCSILLKISAMPNHLRQEGEPIVTAGANLFCISFFPSCRRPSRQHVVIYDVSKQLWYALDLPGDHISYRCFSIVEPWKTLCLPDCS